MKVFYNHEFVREEVAGISVNNRSFRYGEGCFETMKILHGKAVLQQLHMERLFAGLQQLQFNFDDTFNPNWLMGKAMELADRNGHLKAGRMRITVSRGDGFLNDVVDTNPQVLIQTWPLQESSNSFNSKGLQLGGFHVGHKACDAFSPLKSNNFLLYAMAALHAKKQGWDDALVLNEHGRIADATIANVWILENRTLITPPLSEGPVNGTMRKLILSKAAALNFQCKEEPITVQRILDAEEAMLTNAIYGLRWVAQFGASTFTNNFSSQLHDSLIAPLWS